MNNHNTLLYRIVQQSLAIRYDSLSPEVRQRAGFALTDALINCLEGRRFHDICDPLLLAGGIGKHAMIGTNRCTDRASAVFYNVVSGSVTARNDHHAAADVHPGSVLVPALLAAAEEKTCTGPELLAALVAGYEVMIRLGLTLHAGSNYPPADSLRASMLPAPIGVAIAVGKLIGLDADRLTCAAALACHHMCGVEQWRLDGTSEDVYQNGWDTVNALHCVDLAKAGIQSTAQNLDGPYGFLRIFGAEDQAEACFSDLGKRYLITEVRGKVSGACARVLAPMQIAQSFCTESSSRPEEIEKIKIHVNHKCTTKDWYLAKKVNCYSEAINSVPFAAAATLVAGAVENVSWMPPYDPAIAGIMDRMELVYDQYSEEHLNPDGYLFEFHMQDGTVVRKEQLSYDALSAEGLQKLFDHAAADCCGQQKAQRLWALLQSLPDLPDAAAIIP